MSIGEAITSNLLTFDPMTIVVLALLAGLYLRAVDVLRGRGRTVPRAQQAAFFSGLSLIAVGLLSFPDALAGELLSMHMVQHMLLADLSAPLLLIGVRAPLLYFFWPRPILVAAARTRILRVLWSQLVRPPVALTVWLVILYAWHLPPLYEAALRHTSLHVLEHAMFAFGGFLAWWPIFDPTHHRLEARIWKSLYVAAARLLGGVLGTVLLVKDTQVYGFYGERSRAYGISPLTDQSIAGGIMMGVDFVIMTVGFFYFLLRMGAEAAERDRADREAQTGVLRGAADAAAADAESVAESVAEVGSVTKG